jgi:hypothetical protein
VLTINGAWKPNMHEAMQLHLKLVAQALLRKWRLRHGTSHKLKLRIDVKDRLDSFGRELES